MTHPYPFIPHIWLWIYHGLKVPVSTVPLAQTSMLMLCVLSYPTINHMVQAAVQANRPVTGFLFNVDLERAFWHLRIDPNDYDLLGLFRNWSNYQDCGVTFGAKLGSFFCQLTTDAIRYIMAQYGFQIFSDDILAIHSEKDISDWAFQSNKNWPSM